MVRALLMAVVVAAMTLASPATQGPPAAEAGIVACDLKVSINRGPPSDGGDEFYRRWALFLEGTGFPPSTSLELRVLADSVLVHQEELPSAADGTVARNAEFIGFLAEPYDAPTDFRIVILDPANPGGCTDTIDLLRLPDPPFEDIVFSDFLDEITSLHADGLLAGCRPTLFCPSNAILRGEMAVLLVRSLALPATTDDFFTDDEGHKYEWAINRLGAAGITIGCAEGRFCPDRLITRDEVASFLVASFELPPSDVDAFTDDDGNTHEADINALAASGITNGCSSSDPTRYCPSKFVLREQFAGFLYRALL